MNESRIVDRLKQGNQQALKEIIQLYQDYVYTIALQMLKKKEMAEEKNFLQTLILSRGNKKYGFTVDEIVNEQEVLVKNLGKQLSRVPNVSGVTMMGNGKIIPILNVSDLMKSAV